MSNRTAKILEEALELPTKERAEVIARLIDSMDPAMDEGVESAWAAELARRIEDVESGRVKPIPWNEARAKVFDRGDLS